MASLKAHEAPPPAPYTIYLSNNFVGADDWRVQMEKEATVAAGLAPFKGKVKLTITNAQNTAPAQISLVASDRRQEA